MGKKKIELIQSAWKAWKELIRLAQQAPFIRDKLISLAVYHKVL